MDQILLRQNQIEFFLKNLFFVIRSRVKQSVFVDLYFSTCVVIKEIHVPNLWDKVRKSVNRFVLKKQNYNIEKIRNHLYFFRFQQTMKLLT